VTRRLNPGDETVTTPTSRAFALSRRRTAPPDLSTAPTGWTAARLANAPSVVSCMVSACSDDTLSQIQLVVAKEAQRRAEAA
jgi:hypothetical protein